MAVGDVIKLELQIGFKEANISQLRNIGLFEANLRQA
jgi:hypothetical protein